MFQNKLTHRVNNYTTPPVQETLTEDPRVQSAAALRGALASELLRLQSKNPSYSLRRFARRLGVVPSALCEVMAGRRQISWKMAERMALGLGLPPSHFEPLKQKKVIGRRAPAQNQLIRYAEINMDRFSQINDWYYFAICSLVECESFNEDAAWVAERLNIKEQDARIALIRLEEFGMLKRNEEGKLVPGVVNYATSSDTANLAIRRGHYQNLELARESLDRDPVELRDFSSVTMAMDKDMLPQAKQLMKKFRRDLTALMESGKKRDVFRLCIQFFPLTQIKGDSK